MELDRTDVQTFTLEQVRELLRDSLALVAELEPPAGLEVAVFTEAARLLAQRQVLLNPKQSPAVVAGMAVPRGPVLR